MNLASIRKGVKDLEIMSNQMLDNSFSKEIDANGNLFLSFYNGNQIKLPVLKLRPYQQEVQEEIFLKETKRLFLVWPRRAGKEVVTWNILIMAAIHTPGLYLMIYPTNVRARKILWDGAITLPNGESFNFIDMIPRELVASINNQEMKIKLKNGAVINVIGSDQGIHTLRGTNARGAIYSEWAFSDPRVMYTLMPVFRQNGGWFIIQTTYNGMNHAYRYMKEVEKNEDWFCRVESVDSLKNENEIRYITDEMIEEDRRSGMPEWMIQQEYYSKVELNQDTLYFSHEMNHVYENERLVKQLMIVNSPVDTFWDIGINDCTAILLVQVDFNNTINVIHYIENNNQKLEYYIQEIRRFCVKHNLLLRNHYIPHDGQKRDFNTGKNTVDFARDLGEQCYIVPKPSSKHNAIETMRRVFYRVYFNAENTTRLIDCLSNYSKEYDEKMGIYKDQPIHNWASHGADAFQTMALAFEANMIGENKFEIMYYQ